MNGWYRLRGHIEYRHASTSFTAYGLFADYDEMMRQVNGAIKGLSNPSGVTQREREGWGDPFHS